MRISTGIKLGGSSIKGSKQQDLSQGRPNQWADVLPEAGGIVGQIGGGIVGLRGGAGGAKAGQVIGGGGGQMIGDALKQLFEGQGGNMNAGELLSNAGQGALYSLLPGGKMAEGIANPLLRAGAKAGVRAAGGAAVGAGTQGIRNIQQGKPLTQGMGGQAVASGALNTIVPGGAEALGVLGKGAQWLGKRGGEMGQNVVARKGMAATQAVQKLFGGQTVSTGKGTAQIAPEVQALFKKYGYTPPPEGDVHNTMGFLNRASQDVENHLQPILNAEKVTGTDVSALTNKNLETFYGTSNIGAKSKGIPLEIKTFLGKLKGNDMTLSELKTFQRGLKDYGNWSSDTKTPTEKFANSLYRDVGNLIESKLKAAKLPKGWDATAYNELQQQHQTLAKMRDNFEPYTSGKQLPTEVLSKEMGQTKQLGGMLSNERLLQIALRSAAPFATESLGGAIGLPPQIKHALSAIELAALLPGAVPEAGPAIEKTLGATGKGLQAPSSSKKFMDVLGQLGVRLPSAGQ